MRRVRMEEEEEKEKEKEKEKEGLRVIMTSSAKTTDGGSWRLSGY